MKFRMSGRFFFLVLLSMILLLSSCSNGTGQTESTPFSSDTDQSIPESTAESSTPAETSAPDTSEPSSEQTTETSADDSVTEDKELKLPTMPELLLQAGCPEDLMIKVSRTLDAEEAESFEAYFEDRNTWCFLSALYKQDNNFFQPKDAGLAAAIYASHDHRLTDEEEKQALRKAKGLEEEDFLPETRRFTTAELSAWVETYLGVSLSQEMIDRMMATTDWGARLVYYLEEYDAYYLSAGDTNVFPSPAIAAGYVTEDGRYLLFLYSAIFEDSFRLALYEPAENGYHLNMMVYLDGLY